MDSYDQVGCFQHADRDFAWDYLRAGGDEDESARRSLMDIHRWDNATTAAKLDFAIHVLLRYKFLDVVSNVLGCEKHPGRKLHPKLNVELPTRVEQVSPYLLLLKRQLIIPAAAGIFVRLAALRGEIRDDVLSKGHGCSKSWKRNSISPIVVNIKLCC